MCDDGHPRERLTAGLTRRRFVQGAGVLAASGLLPRVRWQTPAYAATTDGSSPVSMAMHIHSSFSEYAGSMDAHLSEALRTGVDVIWWTDHDWRMSAFDYRNVVHFNDLSGEAGDGKPWTWKQERVGSLTTASTGGIVASPTSPFDSVAGGSLQVRAQSTSVRKAALQFFADSKPARWNYHGNLAAETLYLEVFPEEGVANGFLELLLSLSAHPARGRRPAGQYSISYRFGGKGTPGSRVSKGLLGVVTLPVETGQWNSVVLHPDEDIAALWPDMPARDNSLFALRLGATSFGAVTSGYFDYLRFSRSTSGDVALRAQQEIGAALAPAYPGVAQRQGLEVSYVEPHINWFGGAVTLPDYSGASGKSNAAVLQPIIADIHARGGVTSYNHPFGVGWSAALLSTSQQDQKLANVAASLISNGAMDNDMIEVGYPSRSGVDLAHHVAAWDSCSRNGIFLTGNGTSDDHDAVDWLTNRLNWVTYVWALSQSEADLLAALRAGRAWTGSLTGFRGSLDMLADGSCPMGSVSVSALNQRSVLIGAVGVPINGGLRVVQGLVDYAGPNTPRPSNRTVATYPDTDLAAGSVTLPVDTTVSSFLRTEVLDSTGKVVGLSNPIWLLREPPTRGLPPARAC